MRPFLDKKASPKELIIGVTDFDIDLLEHNKSLTRKIKIDKEEIIIKIFLEPME